MSRPASVLVLGVVALLLAGCRCDPCRRRCPPCDPCAPAGVVVAGSTSPAVPMPTPRAGASREAGGLHVVTRGAGTIQVIGPVHATAPGAGTITVIGPDGKPMVLPLNTQVVIRSGGEAHVVQEGGKTVIVIEEEEGEKGEKEEGEGAEHHGAVKAPAPATPPAPAAPAAPLPQPGERGFLGFTPAPVSLLSPEQREHWNVKAKEGVVAVRVMKGSPAEKAGLRDGDVLIRFAGKDVPSTQGLEAGNPESLQAFGWEFSKIAAGTRPGGEVEVVVMRDGKPVTLKAVAVDFATIRKIAAAAGDDEEDEDEGEEPGERHEGPEKGETPHPKPTK